MSRAENVLELKSNIAEFEANHEGGTLADFLEEIALFTDIDRYDQQADAVTMMTMHSAKGLEFPIVFLCGVEEGLFPSYRSMDSEEELEEERRICYVAMTRAKRKLYITCAQRRMLYGQTSFAKPSRFIEEIPEERLDKHQRQRPAAPRRTAAIRPAVSKSFASALIKLSSGAKEPLPDLRPGQRITHKAFGDGVVAASTPMGNDVLAGSEVRRGRHQNDDAAHCQPLHHQAGDQGAADGNGDRGPALEGASGKESCGPASAGSAARLVCLLCPQGTVHRRSRGPGGVRRLWPGGIAGDLGHGTLHPVVR